MPTAAGAEAEQPSSHQPSEAAPTSVAAPAPEEPTPEELERWVTQLDDDLYATRETAQRRLEDAGQSALPAVASAAQQGNLETSTRAVNILLKWSSETSNQWRLGSLEALMKLKNRPAESALATKILERVREEVAMLRLLEAGAKIRQDPTVLLLRGTRLPMQVVIDPDWKGDLQTLESLADFRSLSTLGFHSAPFDQETLEKKILPMLEASQQIRRLQIYGTPISEAAVARLKQRLPGIEMLDIRSGDARLGVKGSIEKNDRRLSEIEPGSAADRAGLRVNDVITHVDGQEVSDFKHLTELIAGYHGGDEATLTVVRQPSVVRLPQPKPSQPDTPAPAVKPEEIVVKFDRWGDVQSAEDLASQLTIEELRQRTNFGPTNISRRR